MPKARETCTRCSMRRQKCDRKLPCTRCQQAGVAELCSRRWGGSGYDSRIHRKYPNSMSSLMKEETHSAAALGTGRLSGETAAQPPRFDRSLGSSTTDGAMGIDYSNHGSAIEALQTLLPTMARILQLVSYFEDNLSWYHEAVCLPTFRRELELAPKSQDQLMMKSLDPKWSAVLFAILASCLTCAPYEAAIVWGFDKQQKRDLGRKWSHAVLDCLQLGKYLSRPHIYSVQAAFVLSASAHINGLSTELFTLFGAAYRIAINLRLHRLEYDADLDSIDDVENMSARQHDTVIQRDTGRRLWAQCCIQDWLTVFLTDTYMIDPEKQTTAKPRRLDADTMLLVPEEKLMRLDFTQFCLEVSRLVVKCFDSMSSAKDTQEKYKVLLHYDCEIRAISSGLLGDLADAPSEPWIRWASQEASIVLAHKILTIHRTLLPQSFTNPRYAYTRWASIEASKSIIKNVSAAVAADPGRPAFWNDQAHNVSAAATICVDLSQRPSGDPEIAILCDLIDQSLSLLRSHEDSVLAEQAIRLMSSFMHREKTQQPREGKDEQYPWPLQGTIGKPTIGPSSSSLSTASPSSPLAETTPTTSSLQGVMDPKHAEHEDVLQILDNGMMDDLSWIAMVTECFPPQGDTDYGSAFGP